MRKLALLMAVFGLMSGGLTLSAVADDNQTVNATVTPLLISVNVTPASVSYGTQPFSATEVVPNPASVSVTNNGSVTETFQIRGAASTPSGWTLGGTAGSNTYVHRFKLGQGIFAPLTISNQLLVSNVPTTSNVDVFLNLDMPTSSTFLTQQTLPVTILATQS